MNETAQSDYSDFLYVSWETLLRELIIKTDDTLGYEEIPDVSTTPIFSNTNPPNYEYQGKEKILIQIIHSLSKQLEKVQLRDSKFNDILNEIQSLKLSIENLRMHIDELERFKTQEFEVPDSWLLDEI